ncbi:MAG: hypothetical protein ACLPG5_10330, partial [Acidocella sp.]
GGGGGDHPERNGAEPGALTDGGPEAVPRWPRGYFLKICKINFFILPFHLTTLACEWPSPPRRGTAQAIREKGVESQ